MKIKIVVYHVLVKIGLCLDLNRIVMAPFCWFAVLVLFALWFRVSPRFGGDGFDGHKSYAIRCKVVW